MIHVGHARPRTVFVTHVAALASLVVSLIVAALPAKLLAAPAPRPVESRAVFPATALSTPAMPEIDPEAFVVTEGQSDPILDGPPAPENARYVDPQNPSNITYYGTEAGYRYLAPLRSATPERITGPDVMTGHAYTLTVPGPTITDFASAPDGRLFVGVANNGLRVYAPNASGVYQWSEQHTTMNGMASDSVTTLAYLNNQLWIGTAAHGLVRWNLTTNVLTVFNTGNSPLPSNQIRRITAATPASGASHLWIATTAGAARYDPGSGTPWTVLTTAQGLADNEVHDIAVRFTQSGYQVYFATENGVSRWNGTSTTLFLGDNATGCILNDRITHVEVDGASTIWFAPQSEVPDLAREGEDTGSEAINSFVALGLCRFNPATNQWHRFTSFTPGLPTDWVMDMDVDQDGRLWAAFLGDGDNNGAVAAHDQGSWLILRTTYEPALPNSAGVIHAVNEAVWVAHYNTSVASVYAPNWRRFNEDFLQNPGPPGPLLLEADRAWAGVGTSLFSWDASVGGTPYTIPGNSSPVTALYRTDDGLLWIATEGSGLFAWDGNSNFTQYTVADGLPSNNVRALIVDTGNRLWAATDAGLVLRGNNYWLTFATSSSGLASNDLRALTVDTSARLWLGTDAGISIYDPQPVGGNPVWQTLTTADGLPSDLINALATAPSGDVWAATSAGVAHWSMASGMWSTYNAANSGLPGDEALSILSDPVGHIWAGTTTGLARREVDGWKSYHVTGSALDADRVVGLASDQDFLWSSAGGKLTIRREITTPIGQFPPVIQNFTPKLGTPTQTDIVITGEHFHPQYNSVQFCCFGGINGIPGGPFGLVQTTTTTSLVVQVPQGAMNGPILVTSNQLTAVSQQNFTVQPAISYVSKSCVTPGDALLISGNGFTGAGSGGVYVKLGDGPWRIADQWGDSSIQYFVRVGDRSGPVRIRLGSNGAQAQSAQQVSVAQISLEAANIQQAIQNQPMIWGKRTLVQLFLRNSDVHSGFNNCSGTITGGRFWWKKTNGDLQPGANSAFLATGASVDVPFVTDGFDIDDAVNFVAEFNSSHAGYFDLFPLSQLNGARVTLRNGNTEVLTIDIARSQFNYTDPGKLAHYYVAPIVPNNYSQAQYQTFYGILYDSLEQVARMMPQQDTDPWAGEPVWLQHVGLPIKVSDSSINLKANDYEKFDELKCMVDDKKDWANDHRCPSSPGSSCYYHLTYGMGAVAAELDASPTAGHGRFGDWSGVGFNEVDYFGFTMAHEGIHLTSWVDSDSANHDSGNESHSKYDEGESEANCSNSLTFRQALLDQTGVPWRVYRLDGDDPYQFTMAGCGDNTIMPRALMAYTPNRDDWNGFFEPLDITHIQNTFKSTGVYYSPTQTALSQENAAGASSAEATRTLRLAGVIDRADTVTVTLSYWLDDGDVASSVSDPTGDHRVRMVNAANATLVEHRFKARREVPGEEDETNWARFSFLLPFPDGVTRVEILRGNQVIWSGEPSANPPTGSVIAPNGGSYNAADTIAVTWTASDPDGGPLTFALEYTPDDGQSWSLIATGLTGSSYEWTPGFVPASAQGRLRLHISDGFHTALVTPHPSS